MEFDRNALIDSLQANGNIAEAAQASVQLPEVVDASVAQEWLAGAGIDPQEILGQLPIAEGQEVFDSVTNFDAADAVSNFDAGETVSSVTEGGLGDMFSGFVSKLFGRGD